ncbi:MAG: hypothetical protein KKD01_19625 [Proteobacteria bacterium]|nr:hypothetical protein [Pseudomonadota bacterium]
MNYLIQARNEYIIKNAGLYNIRLSFFQSLFFGAGNGIIFKDGNPFKSVEFNRVIPYKHYYSDIKPFEEMKAYYLCINEDRLIGDNYNFAKVYDKDASWLDSVQEVKDEYNHENISPISIEQLFNRDYYYDAIKDYEIRKTNRKHLKLDQELGLDKATIIYLPNYENNIDLLNQNSCPILLRVAVAFLQGFALYYKECVEKKVGDEKHLAECLEKNNIRLRYLLSVETEDD